jgi:cytochrome c556
MPNQNPRNVGALIPQGKCIDCGEDWSMYESEIEFYKNLMKTKNFSFPKRCRACREKKRKENRVAGIKGIVDSLHEMAAMAENGYYDDGDRFAAQLHTLAENLDVEYKKLLPKPDAQKGQRSNQNHETHSNPAV